MNSVFDLTMLDVGVLLVYVAVLAGTGFLLSRRNASAGDFFLASREARWPVIGLSLIAAQISPTVLIGVTGTAYAIGISVYNYEWMAAIVLAVFALIFLPVVLRSRVYTVPEFLERRFDGRARLWFAGVTLLLTMLLDSAGTLYGGALLLRMVFPGVELYQGVAVLSLLAGLYALTGGLRSVMYTEAVQGIILFGSALALAVLAVTEAGGLDAILHIPPEKLSLIQPASDPFMPWTGLLFGAPILGFYFWCTNQFMVQRMLAAHSIEDGQKGALLAGFLKLTTLAFIVAPGLAAIALYPNLTRADDAYPKLLVDLMPSGLLGLMIATFFGSLMAQLSGTYNSAATLITMDFVRRFKPDLDSRRLVRWGRFATIGCILLSIAWAPQIDRFPSLWQYLQAVMAYVTPPVVTLFLGGTLWSRANATGATAAIIAGSGVGLTLFTLSVLGIFELQFLLVAAVVFACSTTALVAGSLVSPAPAFAAIADLLVLGQRGSLWAPAQRSVTIAAVALIVTTAAIVIILR